MKRNLGLLALMGVLILIAAPVRADGDFYVVAGGGGVGTRITSLPYEITKPGFYYLAGDLEKTTMGNGIIISTDGITLDLMGFSLKGVNEGFFGISSGIIVGNRTNVEIRNGTIRGWKIGIEGSPCNNIRLLNLRLQNLAGGISLTGYNHLIKGCTISENGSGMQIDGSATISGNAINNNTNVGVSITKYGTVTGNTMSNSLTVLDFQGAGSVIGNTITSDPGQISLKVTTDAAKPVLLDQNTLGGAGTPYSGGGNNVIKGTNAGFPPPLL